MRRVFVAGVGSHLPGDPVPNSSISEILGRLESAPPDVNKYLKAIERRIVKATGIEARHFAIDRTDGHVTHSVTSLAAEAARHAMSAADLPSNEVEFLLVSSPYFDQMTPPSSAALQEALGIDSCAEMSIHSNCAGLGKMAQVAFDALRVGRYRTALVVYSQLSSPLLRACYFNQTKLTRSQAALRYVLADGSGAVLLTSDDALAEERRLPEVLCAYSDSFGCDRPAAMTATQLLIDHDDSSNSLLALFESGLHHVDQDFLAVNTYAVPGLLDSCCRMLSTIDLVPADIDHFVFSLPNRDLFERHIVKETERHNVDPDCVKFRSTHTGYCGGASVLIHFCDMLEAGEIQPGQKVALHSIESSKWMSGGFVIRS